jgi:transcriptional regulator with XRE-family HTH domain
VQSIRERLLDAWERSGLTLDQLASRAGLATTKYSLSRKLRGLQAMRTEESEALEAALEKEMSAAPKRGRKARA